jgi:hypothetical protein
VRPINNQIDERPPVVGRADRARHLVNEISRNTTTYDRDI